MARSFDVSFDLRLNKRLSKQSWCWWFETLSCPLLGHFNDFIVHHLELRARKNGRHHLVRLFQLVTKASRHIYTAQLRCAHLPKDPSDPKDPNIQWAKTWRPKSDVHRAQKWRWGQNATLDWYNESYVDAEEESRRNTHIIVRDNLGNPWMKGRIRIIRFQYSLISCEWSDIFLALQNVIELIAVMLKLADIDGLLFGTLKSWVHYIHFVIFLLGIFVRPARCVAQARQMNHYHLFRYRASILTWMASCTLCHHGYESR